MKRRTAPILYKPLQNKDIISKFLQYYTTAEKFTWHKQPWYHGTGLHYSDISEVKPLAAQVCGGGYNNLEYQNTMLFDKPINPTLLQGIDYFPLVRCKITSMLPISGGNSNENFLWHKDEKPHEVLRVIVPLESSNEYQFQLDNYMPMYLEPGNVYAFDQSCLHRIYKVAQPLQVRTHLVLSYVTWFDKVKDEWIPNEYAGKIHPLELFDRILL
jgi:hypothetical protein